MAPRCKGYLTDIQKNADIVLRQEEYQFDIYPNWPFDAICYMESCKCFYSKLLNFEGMLMHASAVVKDGKAYLFSGPSTVGKSTHARQWQRIFGDAVYIINDDKPALRLIDECWYAYGTPWCGKDGINQNCKAPLAGICFLKQAGENRIRRLSPAEAIPLIMSQTTYKFKTVQRLSLLLDCVDKLVRKTPIFELENLPNEEAALLCYSTMVAASEENG
jgi:hypothetical protein